MTVPFQGSARGLSAWRWPAGGRGSGIGVVLAPGASSGGDHASLTTFAGLLAVRRWPTLTFTFPYRDAGPARPDPLPRLIDAWQAVAGHAPELLGADRVVVGGRSMGGRIASVAVAERRVEAAGLALLAYPLHPPGKPDQLRVAHWDKLHLPVLFLHGDRDPFGSPEELRSQAAGHLATAEVHLLDGADHAWRTRRKDGRTTAEVLEEAASTLDEWLRRLG